MSKEVIVFSSPTCAPCRQMKPEMKRQSFERGFDLRIVEMSAESQAEFKLRGVRAAPTIICVDDGVEIGRFVGATTSAEIEGHLEGWGL